MFDYIKGILIEKNYPNCTIECNNVGYNFIINSRTLNALGDIGSEVKIYAKLIHREDAMYLCGFKSKPDRTLFNILISVSGVGVKVAFSLLEEFETLELINAVLSQDYKLISRTKGVGPKMAQKIVLEIKDKLKKLDVIPFVSVNNQTSQVSSETINQVASVLDSLGYSQNEYQNAIETVLTQNKKDDVEEILKEVLQILSIF